MNWKQLVSSTWSTDSWETTSWWVVKGVMVWRPWDLAPECHLVKPLTCSNDWFICAMLMMCVSVPLSPSVPQDKEVDLEQVQQRFSGLISDDDLSHKQLPASPLDVSTLDVSAICQRQDSHDTMSPFPPGALSVPSLFSESGAVSIAGRNMPLPLSSSTLPPPSRCKHRAPNGGILHQSPIKMPVKYQPVPSRAMDTNHGTSIWHHDMTSDMTSYSQKNSQSIIRHSDKKKKKHSTESPLKHFTTTTTKLLTKVMAPQRATSQSQTWYLLERTVLLYWEREVSEFPWSEILTLWNCTYL